MSKTNPNSTIYKHKSWSPDIIRDEEWAKRKRRSRKNGNSSNKSVTDDDIDELKACIELGFGFDETNEETHHLSGTFPALPFYYAVNNKFKDITTTTTSSSSSHSSGLSSPSNSSHDLFASGDNPEMMKSRLRQWAQVVACSLRQSSSSSSLSSQ